MPLSELSYKSADGTRIAAYRWEPEGDHRGHGATADPDS
jgi:hypothetical protein